MSCVLDIIIVDLLCSLKDTLYFMLLLIAVSCTLSPGKILVGLSLLLSMHPLYNSFHPVLLVDHYGNLMYSSFTISVSWKHKIVFASCTMFGFIKKLGINITHIECKAEYLAHSKPSVSDRLKTWT